MTLQEIINRHFLKKEYSQVDFCAFVGEVDSVFQKNISSKLGLNLAKIYEENEIIYIEVLYKENHYNLLKIKLNIKKDKINSYKLITNKNLLLIINNNKLIEFLK